VPPLGEQRPVVLPRSRLLAWPSWLRPLGWRRRMHNTLRLLQPIPLLQLTALLQAIQLVDILQPLMAGRAMATAQDHPTSCAKLSERARLVTVAPTLSPMPNGKPLSSASGTAESASSAIAFRRTDYWLKPRRNARRARPAMRAWTSASRPKPASCPIDAFGGRTAAVKARNAGSKSGRILTIR
jgi:hypothetical protein